MEYEPQEISAGTCENYCEHRSALEAWLAETDTWYCEECLAYYFIEEIRSITGYDEELEDMTFIAHTDDEDEFTHFVMIGRKGISDIRVEITLARLEKERKKLQENER